MEDPDDIKVIPEREDTDTNEVISERKVTDANKVIPERKDTDTSKVHKAMKLKIRSRDADVDYDEVKQRLFKCARSKEQIPEEHFTALKFDVGKLKFRELVNEIDERGNTALHYAAKAGNLDTCKLDQALPLSVKPFNFFLG